MPRTKVSKSSKRNREAANREEKIREFDTTLDDFLNKFETVGQEAITDIEGELNLILQRMSSALLQMKVSDLLEMKLSKFSEWTQNAPSIAMSSSQSLINASSVSELRVTKASNPNDEGYITEDSTNSGGCSIGSATTNAYIGMTNMRTQQQQHGRTPGPLSSARARRPRRSRSACGDFGTGSTLKAIASANVKEHSSRSKMRTPVPSRTMALSADRTPRVLTSPQSPPTAFMRWPKPGEMVLSKCGTPVVAQVMPDNCANVNIPVRNGVLSLRPKKLSELKPDIIESIGPETLDQIRTLHANLNFIMNMADKTIGLK